MITATPLVWSKIALGYSQEESSKAGLLLLNNPSLCSFNGIFRFSIPEFAKFFFGQELVIGVGYVYTKVNRARNGFHHLPGAAFQHERRRPRRFSGLSRGDPPAGRFPCLRFSFQRI